MSLQVQLQNDTVWLTQAQMAELFGKERSVISKHIPHVFKEGELDENTNVQKMHNWDSIKPTAFYSLDTIISVGYRVKSKQGTQFRIWANRILKEYLIKGFATQEKLKLNQLESLKKTVALLANVIHKKELTADEATLMIAESKSDGKRYDGESGSKPDQSKQLSLLPQNFYNRAPFNRRLFITTETELKAIAAPAIIGSRRKPFTG